MYNYITKPSALVPENPTDLLFLELSLGVAAVAAKKLLSSLHRNDTIFMSRQAREREKERSDMQTEIEFATRWEKILKIVRKAKCMLVHEIPISVLAAIQEL